MLNVEEWQKFGTYVAKNWLSFLIGAVAGMTLTALLYDKFIVAGMRQDLERYQRAAPSTTDNLTQKTSSSEPTTSPDVLGLATVSVNSDLEYSNGLKRHLEGSGVILEAGRVLTALHLVQAGEASIGQPVITVRAHPSDAGTRATILKTNSELDLALLSVDVKEAPTRRFNEKVRPGDNVVLVGFPAGADKSVVHSSVVRVEPLGLVIQGSISPGFAGAPVYDHDGALVGLLIHGSEQEISAVPSTLLREFARI